MAFTTFTGPVRSGHKKDGAASTQDCGLVELVQMAVIPATAILTSPAAVQIARLPAGSKILNISVEVTVALTTATNCGLTIGKSGGTANFFVTTFNTGATANKVAQSTVDTATVVAQTNNVGTSEVVVTATPTAATGNAAAGEIVVYIRYLQRNSDGTTYPLNP